MITFGKGGVGGTRKRKMECQLSKVFYFLKKKKKNPNMANVNNYKIQLWLKVTLFSILPKF